MIDAELIQAIHAAVREEVQQTMREEVQPLKESIELLDATMQAGFAQAHERIDEINRKLDTDISPKLDALVEGLQVYADRLPKMDQMAGDIAVMKENVAILVNAHSELHLTEPSKEI